RRVAGHGNAAGPGLWGDLHVTALSLRAGAVSVVGNVRQNNEDRCHMDAQLRFFLVADGMGGQAAGEEASSLAVEVVSRRLAQAIDFQGTPALQVARAIDRAVAEANAEIMAQGALRPGHHNMGTTLALLVRVGRRAYAAGVGDSPIILRRGATHERLTKDHSMAQALLDAGTITAEEFPRNRFRNILYRYLGTKEGGLGTKPREVLLKPGDRFALFSDGATDGQQESQVVELLGQGDDPQEVAQRIVDGALLAGSRDNVTCLVVFVEQAVEVGSTARSAQARGARERAIADPRGVG
ncbi:MAG: PP2C family protein-serine/threonine phosphatase, partial [Planctomycetaceae bacterium]